MILSDQTDKPEDIMAALYALPFKFFKIYKIKDAVGTVGGN